LQAAFIDYGGNRHGFLAFSEVHPDYYRIPVGDRLHGTHTYESSDDHDDDVRGNGAGSGEDAGVPLVAALPDQVQVPQSEAEDDEAEGEPLGEPAPFGEVVFHEPSHPDTSPWEDAPAETRAESGDGESGDATIAQTDSVAEFGASAWDSPSAETSTPTDRHDVADADSAVAAAPGPIDASVVTDRPRGDEAGEADRGPGDRAARRRGIGGRR